MGKKKKAFAPLDRVIWFKTDGYYPPVPVLAWVCSEEFHPCRSGDMVAVSANGKDATEGKGKYVSEKVIYHYSEFFWDACKNWLSQKEELDRVLRKELMKGKIPKAYAESLQGELFDGFSDVQYLNVLS